MIRPQTAVPSAGLRAAEGTSTVRTYPENLLGLEVPE